MRVKSLSPQEFQKKLEERWPTDPAHARAAVLRALVWAHGVVYRRALLTQAFKLAELGSMDHWIQTCEDLERRGDITTGDRGRLAAAPLRFVAVVGDRCRLFGGPDALKLDESIDIAGYSRTCSRTIAEDLKERFQGLIMNAERWAGFNREPVADQAFLSNLDLDLESHPIPAGPTTNISEEGWRAYEEGRWRAVKKGNTAQLWRVRGLGRYWRFSWTEGGHPDEAAHIFLNRDTATRTQRALDRHHGWAPRLKVEERGEEVFISLPIMLPLAEYRYCLVQGEFEANENIHSLKLPKSGLAELLEMLEERVGLVRETAGGS